MSRLVKIQFGDFHFALCEESTVILSQFAGRYNPLAPEPSCGSVKCTASQCQLDELPEAHMLNFQQVFDSLEFLDKVAAREDLVVQTDDHNDLILPREMPDAEETTRIYAD